MRVVGFVDGFDGLLHPETALVLDYVNTAGIGCRGGTILGTSNRGSFAVKTALGERRTLDPAIIERTRATLRELDVGALVCIGGDGSLTIALQLAEAGIPIVGIPKTIDNDLCATDFTFGFDSAVSDGHRRARPAAPTADSHRRIMVVEVMGRHAGWIALYGGIAGGADVILIPEIPFDLDVVAPRFRRARSRPPLHHDRGRGGRGAARWQARRCSGGVGRSPSKARRHRPVDRGQARELTGKETRSVVLGHLQRGGAPTSFDRTLATRFGGKAVQLLLDGEFDKMVAFAPPDIVGVPLADVCGRTRNVPAGQRRRRDRARPRRDVRRRNGLRRARLTPCRRRCRAETRGIVRISEARPSASSGPSARSVAPRR